MLKMKFKFHEFLLFCCLEVIQLQQHNIMMRGVNILTDSIDVLEYIAWCPNLIKRGGDFEDTVGDSLKLECCWVSLISLLVPLNEEFMEEVLVNPPIHPEVIVDLGDIFSL